MTAQDGGAGRRTQALANLRCPQCAASLQEQAVALACRGCATRYPLEHGIIDFRQQGVAAQQSGLALTPHEIATLSADNWVDTIRGLLVGRADMTEMLEELTAAGRTAWKGLLDLKPGGRLLVLGCGYGNLVQHIAPHMGQVYGLDRDDRKLRFAQKRLSIFNHADDITLLAVSEPAHLPFVGEYFDCVILPDGLAPAGQGAALREIRRILKPDGQIFLVAENRLNLTLLTGEPDPWANAPRLLRPVINAAAILRAWWSRRDDRQALPAYERQLKAAGFTRPVVHGFLPGGGALYEILPPKVPWRGGEQSSLKQRLKHHRLFLPAYGLLAQAGGAPRGSTYGRLFEQVARQLTGTEAGPSVRATRMIITRKDKMIVLAGWGDDGLAVRIPFTAAAMAAEERNASNLARLALSHPGLGPRALAEGAVDGIVYRVESMMPGVPLELILQSNGSGSKLARVEALLEGLNPSAGLHVEAFEGARYERLVEARLERLFDLLPDDGQRKRVRAFFQTRLHGASMPFGLLHGDFSCSNIHLAGDGQAGIIDWEAAAFDDLPVLDAIGYLESVHRRYYPVHSLAESYPTLAAGVFPSPAEKRFLFARYERLDLDPACHAGLVYLRWLRHVDYLLPYWLRYHPGGQQRYIRKVVHALLELDSAP